MWEGEINKEKEERRKGMQEYEQGRLRKQDKEKK